MGLLQDLLPVSHKKQSRVAAELFAQSFVVQCGYDRLAGTCGSGYQAMTIGIARIEEYLAGVAAANVLPDSEHRDS